MTTREKATCMKNHRVVVPRHYGPDVLQMRAGYPREETDPALKLFAQDHLFAPLCAKVGMIRGAMKRPT